MNASRDTLNSMSIIARWISGDNGIRITYHNGSEIKGDIQNRILSIPRLAHSAGLSETDMDLIRGGIYHEAGHIRETTIPNYFGKFSSWANVSKILKMIWSHLEDCRMERLICKRFEGVHEYLTVRHNFHNKEIARHLSDGEKISLMDEAFNILHLNSLNIEPLWNTSHKAMKMAKEYQALFDSWITAQNSTECFKIAENIYNKINPTETSETSETSETAETETVIDYPSIGDTYDPHTKDASKGRASDKRSKQVISTANFKSAYFVGGYYNTVKRGSPAFSSVGCRVYPPIKTWSNGTSTLTVNSLGSKNSKVYFPAGYALTHSQSGSVRLSRNADGSYNLTGVSNNEVFGLSQEVVFLTHQETSVLTKKVGFNLSEWPESIQNAVKEIISFDHKEIAKSLSKFISKKFLYSVDAIPGFCPIEAAKSGAFQCDMAAYILVSLLRDVFGIPCRVAVGYRGKKHKSNPVCSFVVLPGDSHAWVEIFYDNQWITVDPTPTKKNRKDDKKKDKSGYSDVPPEDEEDSEEEEDTEDTEDDEDSEEEESEESSEEETEEDDIEDSESTFDTEGLLDDHLMEKFSELSDCDQNYISDKSLDKHEVMVANNSDCLTYQKLREKMQADIVRITSSLERAMRARMRNRVSRHCSEGDIDMTQLVAISKGLSKNVYKTTRKGEKMDTVVQIVIDESGSMATSYEETRLAVIAIAESLARIGIPFEVFGATTTESYRRDLGIFSRSNPIWYRHYKTWNDTWMKACTSISQSGHLNNNIDGETIEYAATRLASRKETRKIIISLCDGEPCGGHGSSSDMQLAKHLKNVCDKVRKSGTEIYCFGINTMNPAIYYGKENYVCLRKGAIGIGLADSFCKIIENHGLR